MAMASLSKTLWRRWLQFEKKVRIFRLVRRRLSRYHADVFLVSFPKSGRTWVRFVLGQIIQQHYRLGDEDNQMVLGSGLMKLAGGVRLKTTHDRSAHYQPGYPGMSKEGFRGKKVILLTRDIRDTLVSYYHHVVTRNHEFEGTLSEFIRSDIFGATKIILFYKSWLHNQAVPAEFYHVRYEDLKVDMVTPTLRMLEMLEVQGVDDNLIQQAVAAGEFDNMKQIEQSQKVRFQGLNIAEGSDPNAARVRQGKTGGYKQVLSQADLDYIDSKVDELGVPREWVYYSGNEK